MLVQKSNRYNHDYWEARASQRTLSMVYMIYDDLRDVLGNYALHYTGAYIGIQKGGKPCNFVYFRPQKNDLWMHVVGTKETAAFVKSHNLEVRFWSDKQPQQMKIRINSISEYNRHRDLLRTIIRNAQCILERPNH